MPINLQLFGAGFFVAITFSAPSRNLISAHAEANKSDNNAKLFNTFLITFPFFTARFQSPIGIEEVKLRAIVYIWTDIFLKFIKFLHKLQMIQIIYIKYIEY